MNILYLTLDDFDSLIDYRSINTDLLREFQKNGHAVYVVSPLEKRKGLSKRVIKKNGAIILKPVIGNMQKTNIFEKGISTLTIGHKLVKAIRRDLADIKVDLILYCTPPITFLSVIQYVKKRDGARTYLLLKDIFPQNAVDLGMMSKKGIKGFIYRYFREKEKRLYGISDRIGCMSQANVDYILEHNPEIKEKNIQSMSNTGEAIVNICPNSVEPINKGISYEKKLELREKYNLPLNKRVIVYGGNLGKAQSIDYLIKCLRSQENRENVFFLIVGSGVDAYKLHNYVTKSKPSNIRLLGLMPKEEYDYMISCCDVGMIITDYRFTIPNFPSRLLAYMAAELPVMCVTDNATDVGNVVVENSFGWKTTSDTVESFTVCIDEVMQTSDEELRLMGLRGFDYLQKAYSTDNSYRIIMNSGLFWKKSE